MSKKVEIEVGGKKLAVSNLEKVLYPKVGFTKGQLIDYYIRISPSLLPHFEKPADYSEALSGWSGRSLFLRKTVPVASANVGENY